MSPALQRLPITLACLCAFLIFAPGCALVTNGLHQKVTIESVPSGATVLVDGQAAGETPLTVNLARRYGHRLELRKPGYTSVAQNVRAGADKYLQRTFRFGLDLDTGAANQLTPALVNVELLPDTMVAAVDGDAFSQMTAAVLAADDLWHNGSVTERQHSAMIKTILARFDR